MRFSTDASSARSRMAGFISKDKRIVNRENAMIDKSINSNDNMLEQKDSSSSIEMETEIKRKDLISSIVIFLFGVFIVVSGVYMCFFASTGTKVWYYSPGFFPLFMGVVLVFLAVVLFIKKCRLGARFQRMNKSQTGINRSAIRLVLSIGLFAGYVFGLIGRIPFVIATFLYLVVTMILFRDRGFAIWKIILVSAITTGLVYLFFGVIAAVPLP